MSTVPASNDLSSRWIIDCEKMVMRGKHVVLYGNVHDQFLWRGRYMTAGNFINKFFAERKFELIINYDPVDGFNFQEPEMRRKFNELVKKRVLEENPGVSGSEVAAQTQDENTQAEVHDARQTSGLDPTQPPPRRSPAATQRGSARQQRRIDPETAFSQLRYVMGQSETSTVAVLNLADMLTSDAARYAENERNALMMLQKCLLGASVIQQGPLAGYRNTLVITAGELKRVPEWLYIENPFVSIVQAARPSREERFQFARTFSNEFYGGDNVKPDDRDDLCDEFSDLTDGFQAWDLEALRRTSWVEKMPVTKLGKLIDYFKFGLREDPWEKLGREKVANAKDILSRRVIGQAYAVDAVCRMLTSARVGLSMTGQYGRRSKPKGVFFFVGPTGVGKTELAKAVTELVFGDERAFARFDMSEYKEEHAAEKLAGAPPGFVGYDEGGQLTNRVLERPHSILLFDEIEKAHPRVLDKFLQILEDGRLTDGKGQTAYFNQAAIIFTSNIGASELYNRARHGQADLTFDDVAEFFQEQVRDYFANKIQRAEIYNRLGDNVVPFDMLRPEYVAAIGQKFLKALQANTKEAYDINIDYDESITTHLCSEMEQGANLLLGGRRIKTLLETIVEHPLNKWVFESVEDITDLSGSTITLVIRDGALEVVRG